MTRTTTTWMLNSIACLRQIRFGAYCAIIRLRLAQSRTGYRG
jgi:hypothetical protein